MAGYLIYLPGRNQQSPDHLSAVGLADLQTDDAPSQHQIGIGPDGGSGTLLWWENPRRMDRVPAKRYDADTQVWHKRRRGAVWYGWEVERPPTPLCIERRSPMPGFGIPLADGNEWVVPNVQQLPAVLGLDDDGKLTREVAAAYQDYYRQAWDALGWFDESCSSGAVPFDEAFRFAVLALSINYRLNVDLCSVLGLLRTDNVLSLVAAAVEREALLATLDRIKKKQPPATSDISATSAGDPA